MARVCPGVAKFTVKFTQNGTDDDGGRLSLSQYTADSTECRDPCTGPGTVPVTDNDFEVTQNFKQANPSTM